MRSLSLSKMSQLTDSWTRTHEKTWLNVDGSSENGYASGSGVNGTAWLTIYTTCHATSRPVGLTIVNGGKSNLPRRSNRQSQTRLEVQEWLRRLSFYLLLKDKPSCSFCAPCQKFVYRQFDVKWHIITAYHALYDINPVPNKFVVKENIHATILPDTQYIPTGNRHARIETTAKFSRLMSKLNISVTTSMMSNRKIRTGCESNECNR